MKMGFLSGGEKPKYYGVNLSTNSPHRVSNLGSNKGHTGEREVLSQLLLFIDTELGTKISIFKLLLVALFLGPPLDVLYTTRKPHTPYAIAIT